MKKMRYEWLSVIVLCGGVVASMGGCAAAPVPAAVASSASSVSEPMTLPRYLGVTSVMRCAHTTLYRSRVRLARHIPVFEPAHPAAVPMALGDPAALQSPAPAVAAAASIQQAEASAPGKIAALQYLAGVDCSQHPQVEEALIASLSDPIDTVRIAALHTILSGQQRCGHEACNAGCSSCAGGCCTAVIHARLVEMASGQREGGCWCEPNATARRLARQALVGCHPAPTPIQPQPLEMPAPEVIEAIGL